MIATVTLNPSLDEWVSLPRLAIGELNRAGDFARYAGGKGINVSRVVHELGDRTIAYGLAGGMDGRLLRGLLRRMRIPHAFVEVDGATRNNYKILTRKPHALTEINTAGPRVTRTDLAALRAQVLGSKSPARLLCLSGSLPPGASVGVYRDWISAANRKGIRVAFDSSGEAFRLGLAARPWLIKPNRQEAGEWLGRRVRTLKDAVEAALRLQRKGPEVVVLSLGEEGALMVEGNPARVWLARPPKVKVDSAVGAGDSMVGGLATGCVRRLSLQESFRLGVACGTATAITPGTELCHRRDVERILRQVSLRRVQ